MTAGATAASLEGAEAEEEAVEEGAEAVGATTAAPAEGEEEEPVGAGACR